MDKQLFRIFLKTVAVENTTIIDHEYDDHHNLDWGSKSRSWSQDEALPQRCPLVRGLFEPGKTAEASDDGIASTIAIAIVIVLAKVMVRAIDLARVIMNKAIFLSLKQSLLWAGRQRFLLQLPIMDRSITPTGYQQIHLHDNADGDG